MNTDNDPKIRLAAYRENLVFQLRHLEVPGERIGQILAEVETHLADTGLDPVVAFGEPGDHAATYASAANSPVAQGGSRSWLRDLGIAEVAGTACSAATVGVIHLTGSVDLTARLIGTWLVMSGIAMIVMRLMFGLLVGETAGSARSRRFTSRSTVFGWLALMAAVAILGLILAVVPTGPTFATIPGWMLVVAGVLAMFVLVRHFRGRGGNRIIDPRN